jgi:hypothetical protein
MAKHRTECLSQTEPTTHSLDAESYYRLRPDQNDCHISINHRCNPRCFSLRESITSIHITSFRDDGKATMCLSCDNYEGHHVGHYHRAGEKVIRRHNGRLVTERLRRPLLHFNDGTELVGYHSPPCIEYVSDLRRRGRNCPIRLPIRVPGHGYMSLGGDGDRYYGGVIIRDHGGYDCYAVFEDMRHGGFGHGYGGHDHDFQNFPPQNGHGHMMHEQHGPRYHQQNDHGHYTTNEGMRGRIENRAPERDC